MSSTNNSLNINSTTPLSIADGGTHVNSVTTTPTATSFAGWDANKNLSANSLIDGYTTTATAAGTTTLTVGSTNQQFFTGILTQTVVLPVTNTLVLGQQFVIVNNSTGVVTVESSGGNTITAMTGGTQSTFTCILTTGTTAASWNSDYSLNTVGVASIVGTANQVIASSPTGVVTLSLPQSIATTSAVQFNTVQFNSNNALLDSNGNEMIAFSPTISAVNYIDIANSATGVGPALSALGSDANINIYLHSKGSGTVVLSTGSNDISIITENQTYSNLLIFPVTTNRSYTYQDANGTLAFAGANSDITSLSGLTGSSTLSNYVANGTWTPIFTFATPGNLSVVYSSQFGFYSQIGNIVTIVYSLIFTPTFTTSSGQIEITGIPVVSGDGGIGTFTCNQVTFPAGTSYLISEVQGGGFSHITVVGIGSATNFTPLTTIAVTTGVQSGMFGTITYLV